MMEENEGAIAEALATDLRRPYTEAVIIEVWDVLAEVIYFEKNLEKLSRTDKLQTPLKMKPLSFEVYNRQSFATLSLPGSVVARVAERKTSEPPLVKTCFCYYYIILLFMKHEKVVFRSHCVHLL